MSEGPYPPGVKPAHELAPRETALGSAGERLARVGQRWKTTLAPLAAALFFGLALWVLHDALRHHRYQDIVAALAGLPPPRLALAVLLSAAGYVVLTGYDLLGFRSIGRPLRPGRIMLGSFVGYALGHNFGHTLFAGAAARYWIHASFGVAAADVARVVVFCSLGFWLGYLGLGAAVFLIAAPPVPAALGLPWATLRPLGIAFLVPLAAYGLLVARHARLRLGGWEFPLPTARLAAGQVLIGILDLLCVATTLWVLLPPVPALAYPQFLAIFLLALAAGAASQVPGGLGVFESAILLLLPVQARSAEVVAALVAFRGIYYLAPLLLAIALVGLRAAAANIGRLRTLSGRLGAFGAAAVPHVLAIAVFVAGALLLFSGALPAAAGRLGWLTRLLPLPLIEASHFLASLVGMLLLLLARGLQRRLDAAYVLTLALLGAGIVLSLAKGVDYEEALVLAAVLVALAPCRSRFYRRASLFAASFTWGWVTSIAIVLAGALWLYAFAFKHVEYANELWWQFALHAEASRALRATVGAAGLGVLFAAARLLGPAGLRIAPAGEAELERARPVIECCPWTYASLAYRGDKALLFDAAGTAFLMYARRGRSWIALGDPVGPREQAAELAWRFRDLCDRHGGWPVFYEVSADNLDLYLDLGLTLIKLGEEARVDLTGFDLSGPSRAGLRQACSRIARLGYRFEILPREAVPAALPQLARVSDAWLARKTTREKGFSNASFDPAYLRRFPVAVIRNDAEIVAFANLLLGAGSEELSIDLMRHLDSAPNGTMDCLFAQLMLWGRGRGYRWFNLGMAPLSGLSARTGAPLWHRFGGLVYQYGDHFYSFHGLRRYKQKFGPVWTPRYLAAPGGLLLPAVLLDVTACVSGGFAGILVR